MYCHKIKNALGHSCPKASWKHNMYRQPGSHDLSALDPWLCVPTFQGVCPFTLNFYETDINIYLLHCKVKSSEPTFLTSSCLESLAKTYSNLGSQLEGLTPKGCTAIVSNKESLSVFTKHARMPLLSSRG